MSNFIKSNETTGDTFFMMDDYFGSHEYGIVKVTDEIDSWETLYRHLNDPVKKKELDVMDAETYHELYCSWL